LTFIVFLAIGYPKISSTDKPRFAATSSGERICARPLTVARTTLTVKGQAQMRSPDDVAAKRGLSVDDILG
jgi:hypothetical protein